MRFDQQKLASFRTLRLGALAFALSAYGSGVSAFGQAVTPPVQGPQVQTPPARPAPVTSGAAQDTGPGASTVKISSDDAVKMALENNLGIRAEQLNPQIQTYAVAQARAAYGPSLFSTTSTRSSTTPPGNFLTGTGTTLSNDSLRTNAGLQQLVPWGGGRYTVSWDASKLTTTDASSRFNPQLDSGLSAGYTQPLLRNFTIDSTRQTVLLNQVLQQVADIDLRQTLTQTSRAVRNAYFDLVNAIAGLEVSQQSLELTQNVAQEQSAARRRRHHGPDRHRAGPGGGRRQRRSGDRRRGPDSDRRGSAPHAGDEPVAARLLDHAARALRAADPRAAAGRRGRGHRQRADESHRPGAPAQVDRTDRHRPEVRPQPAAAGARRDRGLRSGRHRRHAAAVRPGSGRPACRSWSISRTAPSATRSATCSATSSGPGACS